MVAQHGTRQNCLANRTRTRGDCGSSPGKHRRNRGNKLSSPALPIHSAERNHRIAIPIAALTWSIICCQSNSKCG